MRKTNKLLSITTPEQLIIDITELKTAENVAKKYGVSIATSYSVFQIIGYNCKQRQKVSSIVSKEILEEAYARLGSLKAVGRELKIDPDSVKHYMEKFSLEYKKQVIYNCDHDFFSRDNEESFYVAGFLAADGCVKFRNKRKCELYIGLSKNDKTHLELIKTALKAENPIHDFSIKPSKLVKAQGRWKSEITITSLKMCSDLDRFGVVPRKTYIYDIPEWLKTHTLVHHFLRGLNDGDGSFYINKKDNQLRFGLSGTEKLMHSVSSILEKECDLEPGNHIRKKKGQCWGLEYGGNGILSKITDYLYKDATIFLPRKYDLAKKSIGSRIKNWHTNYNPTITYTNNHNTCSLPLKADKSADLALLRR